MDEYAFGFTTENTHYGATRNPHDLARVAGRLVGRLGGGGRGGPRAAHARLRHERLDPRPGGAVRRLRAQADVRPCLARRRRALRGELRPRRPASRAPSAISPLAFDMLQGPDPADPVCTDRAGRALRRSSTGARRATDRGRRRALRRGCGALRARGRRPRGATRSASTRRVTIPEAHRARAAAMVITASEGAAASPETSSRAKDFDPLTRDRFLAGALFRRRSTCRPSASARGSGIACARSFATSTCSLAPTTPWPAPPIGARARRTVRRRRGPDAADTRHFHAAAVVHRPARRSRCRSPRRARCRSASSSSPRRSRRRACSAWRAALEADGVVAAPVASARG